MQQINKKTNPTIQRNPIDASERRSKVSSPVIEGDYLLD